MSIADVVLLHVQWAVLIGHVLVNSRIISAAAARHVTLVQRRTGSPYSVVQVLVCCSCHKSVMGSHYVCSCVSLLVLLKLTPIRAQNLTVRNIHFSRTYFSYSLRQAKNIVNTALNGSDIVQVQAFGASDVANWELPASFRCVLWTEVFDMGKTSVVIYDERSVEPVGGPYSIQLTPDPRANVFAMVKFKIKVDRGWKQPEFVLAAIDSLDEENGDGGRWMMHMALRIRKAGVQQPVIVLGSILTSNIDITLLRSFASWVNSNTYLHTRKLVIIGLGAIGEVLSPLGVSISFQRQHYHQLIEFTLNAAGMASEIPVIEHQQGARHPSSPRGPAAFIAGFGPGQYLIADDRRPIDHASLQPRPKHHSVDGQNVGDPRQVTPGNPQGSVDVLRGRVVDANMRVQGDSRHPILQSADLRVDPESRYLSSSDYSTPDASAHPSSYPGLEHGAMLLDQPGSLRGLHPTVEQLEDGIPLPELLGIGQLSHEVFSEMLRDAGSVPHAMTDTSLEQYMGTLSDRPDHQIHPHGSSTNPNSYNDDISLSDLRGQVLPEEDDELFAAEMLRDSPRSPQSQTQVYSAPGQHQIHQRRMETSHQRRMDSTHQRRMETSHQRRMDTSHQRRMDTSHQRRMDTSHQRRMETSHQRLHSADKASASHSRSPSHDQQPQEYTPPALPDDHFLRHTTLETRLVTSTSHRLLDQRHLETPSQGWPSAYMTPASHSQSPPHQHQQHQPQGYIPPRPSEEHPVPHAASDTREEYL